MDKITQILKLKSAPMGLEEVRKILTLRKEEFIALLKMSQRKAGLPASFDEHCIVPVDDFKACLKAFSIKVSDKVSLIFKSDRWFRI